MEQLVYAIIQFIFGCLLFYLVGYFLYRMGKTNGINIGREQILKEDIKRLNIKEF